MTNTRRADTLIPGDVVNTHCGIPGYALVATVLYIDRPAGLADLVEVAFAGDPYTHTYRVHSEVTVWEGIPADVM